MADRNGYSENHIVFLNRADLEILREATRIQERFGKVFLENVNLSLEYVEDLKSARLKIEEKLEEIYSENEAQNGE